MKIKEGIDVWRCFELALDAESHNNFTYRNYQPINEVLELEEADWLNAIQLCKTHKKYNLKTEIESEYQYWKIKPEATNVQRWLYEFECDIRRTRKYVHTAHTISLEVASVFKQHQELLNKFESLNRLFTSFNTTVRHFKSAKDDYEKATRNMEAFKSIKNSGITPEDFDWGLIEPEQKEKR